MRRRGLGQFSKEESKSVKYVPEDANPEEMKPLLKSTRSQHGEEKPTIPEGVKQEKQVQAEEKKELVIPEGVNMMKPITIKNGKIENVLGYVSNYEANIENISKVGRSQMINNESSDISSICQVIEADRLSSMKDGYAYIIRNNIPSLSDKTFLSIFTIPSSVHESSSSNHRNCGEEQRHQLSHDG